MLITKAFRGWRAGCRMGLCLGSLFILALVSGRPAVSRGQEQRCPRSVPQGLLDVTGYASAFSLTRPDRHIVVVNDGAVDEITYRAKWGILHPNPLFRVADVLAISACAVPRIFSPLAAGEEIVVAKRDGDILQFPFDDRLGFPAGDSRLLAHIPGAVDAGAFLGLNEVAYALVATAGGEIVELAWHDRSAVRQTLLTTIPDATRISGFYDKAADKNIAIVATRGGDVFEITSKDSVVTASRVIRHYADEIIDVGSFYSEDDRQRHAVIGLRGGEIHDFYYDPLTSPTDDLINTVPELRRLAAFAEPDDQLRHIVFCTKPGEVREITYEKKKSPTTRVLGTFVPEATFAEPVSPDTPNGKPQPFLVSTAGLTPALLGSEDPLYALSLNAGLWVSHNGGAWQPLPNSPPLAYCVAQDAKHPSHLVIGEREGHSAFLVLNRSGIWESFDGGNTWKYVFNPRIFGDCHFQAIAAVAFDQDSNIYAATDCGVAKSPAGTSNYQILTGTRFKGSFTAVTTTVVGGQTWVWARTVTDFYLSRDAGLNWESISIPAVIDGDPIKQADRGDAFSLAVYDTKAFTIATGPKGSAAVTYDANTKSWSRDYVNDNPGVGLGGRQLVKSYFLNRPGKRWVLFAGTAQGMFMAVVDAGPVAWRRIAETPFALGPGETHVFNPPSAIHTDIWDVHLTTGDSPVIRIATDGGVYRTTLDEAMVNPPTKSPPYQHQNQGLRTHHAHTVSLITQGLDQWPKIVYSTSDNDAWIRSSSPRGYPPLAWYPLERQGDSNWTAADNGSSPLALMMRDPSIVHLTGFGVTVPIEAVKYAAPPKEFRILRPALVAGKEVFNLFNGQEFFNIIQTTKSEPATPLLDIVMLARLPLASPDPAGRTVLIRNRAFAANPNADESKLSAPYWEIEDDNLPDNAQRIWASGGHSDPVYYLYAETATGMDRKLFRRAGAGQPWKEITPPGLPLLFCKIDEAGTSLFGPAFINPYNPRHLIVSTALDGSGVVKVSHDGGASYQDDAALTALITGSGKYPFIGDFQGQYDVDVIDAKRAQKLATLAHVAFYRDDPGKMVVAAPYTGVFYLDEYCSTWQDLTPLLPTPLPAVSSVAINYEGVYVTLEGRGVFRIAAYEFAPRATHFSRAGLVGRQMARLVRANGSPLALTTVRLTCLGFDNTVLFQGPVTTDGTGAIAFPPVAPPPPGPYTIHIDYPGALPLLAPATTSFFF